jgi:VanZ family protein
MIDRILTLFIENKQLSYALFFLCTLAILLLTLMPPDNLGSHSLFQYDKLGHFLMFFSWTLIYGFLSFARKGSKHTNLIAIFIIGSVFGVTIEFLQRVMPYGRSAGIYDAVADIIGCFSATAFLKLLKIRLQKLNGGK